MKQNSCHSKHNERKDDYWKYAVIYPEDGSQPTHEWIYIKDVMSIECQYRKHAVDAGCERCPCP